MCVRGGGDSERAREQGITLGEIHPKRLCSLKVSVSIEVEIVKDGFLQIWKKIREKKFFYKNDG